MNRTEALVPFSSGSHPTSRTTKLNSSAPKARTKVIRNNHNNHHYNNHHNHHSHHSHYAHHHHHHTTPTTKHDRSTANIYSNGTTSTTASSTNEETDAPSSFSTVSLSPSPSPQAYHASLHNTYHHYHHHRYNYNEYTHANSNKLIPLSLIYGFLRSCMRIAHRHFILKTHTTASHLMMDDDLDSAMEDDDDDDDIDGNEDDDDLPSDHNKVFDAFIPCNITQSILLYFDDDKFDESPFGGGKQCGSFVWRVSTLQLLTAHSMESIPFQIGSFVWHLSVYPYGIDTEHMNFTNLYINLSSSNNTLFHNGFLFELVVNARLYCIETSSCWSSIKTFKSDSDKHGWQKGALLIHELCRYKELTFVVYINILRIRGYDKRIWYQYPLQLPLKHNSVSECNKFVIKWKIDQELLADLRNANEMKRFESDICNNMWVLGCVPNGIKKDNDASVFKIYLKLCALPPNISKIKVKFNIICIETKKHIKYIYNDFDYKHKYWQTDKLCKRNYLIFNDFHTLRFKAEIEIIEQYDANYHELSSNLWKHNIQNHTIQDMITKYPLSPHELKLLIIGYTRRYLPYTVQNIATLISQFYPHCDRGLFAWNINLEQIIKLSKLNAKQRFDSKIFTISNLKWFLQIYPNGYRPEDEGFCSVYLILAYLPSILKEITIHFSVYCPQTMSNFSTIHTFNHSRDGRGTRRMLSLSHLHKIYCAQNGYESTESAMHKFITFNCYINILRIRNDRHHIIYQYPLALSASNYKQYIYSQFKWKIDPKMMKKFKQSNNGQRFESAIFNEMWNLSIFPNENKNKVKLKGKESHAATQMALEGDEEPNVVIGIRLCALPKDIVKIKVHYKLLCVEFESDALDITCKWAHTAVFDYDNYYVKFPKHTIPSHYINTYPQLTFKAEIKIIEIYDLNENIVDKYSSKKAILSKR